MIRTDLRPDVPTPAGTTPGRDRLTADLARRWAAAPHSWVDRVCHVDGERWYTPLFTDPDASAWLITWAPGTRLDLHDHGGAAGSVAVVRGVLTEHHRRRNGGGALATRTIARGELVSFGADHIHEVANLGTEPAVSIHVYAPRLDDMTFYDTGPSTRRPLEEPSPDTRDRPPRTIAERWLGGFR